MQTEQGYLSVREVPGLRCESVGDYSLPDYNGDIRKVLTVKTKILPAGTFVGDDTLELSGSIAYDVVYLDVENTMTHAEFTTDYDAAVRINSDIYVDSDVHTVMAGCNIRLIGPRKISVKATLDSDVTVSEKRTHLVHGDAFIDGSTETKSRDASVSMATLYRSEPKSISEVVEVIEGAIADEVEILLKDVRVRIDGREHNGESVDVKGVVSLTMLYRNGSDAPKLTVKEIPYSESLTGDPVRDAEVPVARVDVSSLKATVEPDENGVSLLLSATLTPVANVRCNDSVRFIEDVYLKDRGCDNEYSDFNYSEHILTETAECEFEGSVSFSDLDINEITDFLFSDSSVRVDSCEIDGNEVKITGVIKFSAIACQVLEDDSSTYVPVKFELPFAQNVNINCQNHNNMSVLCFTDTYDTKMEVVENDIRATATLSSSVTVNSSRRQRCISASYLTDEEYSHDESVVTVYYPEGDETLFEIAKKFHTSVSSIAAQNRLAEEAFSSLDSSADELHLKRLIIG